jgi:hypothetical protein
MAFLAELAAAAGPPYSGQEATTWPTIPGTVSKALTVIPDMVTVPLTATPGTS